MRLTGLPALGTCAVPLACAAPILRRLQQVSGREFQFSGFWGSLLEAVLDLGISRN